jgi:hypothetical protein
LWRFSHLSLYLAGNIGFSLHDIAKGCCTR